MPPAHSEVQCRLPGLGKYPAVHKFFRRNFGEMLVTAASEGNYHQAATHTHQHVRTVGKKALELAIAHGLLHNDQRLLLGCKRCRNETRLSEGTKLDDTYRFHCDICYPRGCKIDRDRMLVYLHFDPEKREPVPSRVTANVYSFYDPQAPVRPSQPKDAAAATNVSTRRDSGTRPTREGPSKVRRVTGKTPHHPIILTDVTSNAGWDALKTTEEHWERIRYEPERVLQSCLKHFFSYLKHFSSDRYAMKRKELYQTGKESMIADVLEWEMHERRSQKTITDIVREEVFARDNEKRGQLTLNDWLWFEDKLIRHFRLRSTHAEQVLPAVTLPLLAAQPYYVRTSGNLFQTEIQSAKQTSVQESFAASVLPPAGHPRTEPGIQSQASSSQTWQDSADAKAEISKYPSVAGVERSAASEILPPPKADATTIEGQSGGGILDGIAPEMLPPTLHATMADRRGHGALDAVYTNEQMILADENDTVNNEISESSAIASLRGSLAPEGAMLEQWAPPEGAKVERSTALEILPPTASATKVFPLIRRLEPAGTADGIEHVEQLPRRKCRLDAQSCSPCPKQVEVDIEISCAEGTTVANEVDGSAASEILPATGDERTLEASRILLSFSRSAFNHS